MTYRLRLPQECPGWPLSLGLDLTTKLLGAHNKIRSALALQAPYVAKVGVESTRRV